MAWEDGKQKTEGRRAQFLDMASRERSRARRDFNRDLPSTMPQPRRQHVPRVDQGSVSPASRMPAAGMQHGSGASEGTAMMLIRLVGTGWSSCDVRRGASRQGACI